MREHAPAEGMSDDQIRTVRAPLVALVAAFVRNCGPCHCGGWICAEVNARLRRCPRQAFEAVATGALDGPLAMGVLRSMFPRETVSGDTVCVMCSQLFRLVPAQQVFLLKWLLMCFATLDDSGHHALRQLYSVFFAALDYEYLRYWAIRVLYTVRVAASSGDTRAPPRHAPCANHAPTARPRAAPTSSPSACGACLSCTRASTPAGSPPCTPSSSSNSTAATTQCGAHRP